MEELNMEDINSYLKLKEIQKNNDGMRLINKIYDSRKEREDNDEGRKD